MEFKTELQIRVACAQHRGEPRDFFLAAAARTGLFEVPVIAHFLQGAFAVDFFLQPPKRPIHWFAFFKPDFGQLTSLPLWDCDSQHPQPLQDMPSRQGAEP